MSDVYAPRFDDAAMAHAYDEYLVPRLFMPWARKLLEQAKVGPNHHVLDVACGTGAVTRLAASLVGLRGRVAGCDPSRSMLAAARAHHRLPNAAGVEYFEVAAEELPFEPGTFHVVTCQQGLPFFKDRCKALAEMHRVLKKGGRLAVSVWGPLESAQYWHALAIAFKRSIPPMAEAVKRASELCEADALNAQLEAAGFAKIEVKTERSPLIFEDGVGQALASVRGTAFGPRIYELATIRAAFEAAARPVFEHCSSERGTVFDMTAHTAIAVKP